MPTSPGKILTFYSFKGGVGRTMAVANTAFLAAMNGLRVLVMDWDLEAPGVAYYFRGLLDPQRARALKDAPGLLNVFWEWHSAVRSQPASEFACTLDRFSKAIPFRDNVLPLMPEDRLPSGASLDYLSAGSRNIGGAESKISYEDALTQFSWPDFFDRQAGGKVLEGLRTWCHESYDLVLIDSRTGLADVAGICTMQMPDEVILSFVLNKQSIDGISRVALAIRQMRKEKVTIRAIPMRTSREGTPEESDARARAISELTRVGGFSQEALNDDFKLAIRSTEGVPFYETLASLLPQSPSIEVFSANYRQLASEIVGRPLKLPDMDQEWLETVHRRLQPRHATIDYLKELENAEPSRIREELIRLLDSALEEEIDGHLDDAYIVALIEATLHLSSAVDADGEALGLVESALDLLRSLHQERGGEWSIRLMEGLQHQWASWMHVLGREDQLAILEEIDSLLAESGTLTSKLTRIDYRIEVARIYGDSSDFNAASQVVSEAWSLVEEINVQHTLAPDQAESIALSETMLNRVEAELLYKQKDLTGAIESYQNAMTPLRNVISESGRAAVARLRFQIAARLSELYTQSGADERAAHWANKAVGFRGASRNFLSVPFPTLARPIVSSADPALAVEFCEAAFLQDPTRSVNAIATMAGRLPRSTTELLDVLAELARLIRDAESPKRAEVELLLVQSAKQSITQLLKRRSALPLLLLKEILQAMNNFRSSFPNESDVEIAEWSALEESLVRQSNNLTSPQAFS